MTWGRAPDAARVPYHSLAWHTAGEHVAAAVAVTGPVTGCQSTRCTIAEP